MNKFLLLNCLAVLTLNGCFQPDLETRKKEIIDFCGKSVDEAAGVIDAKGWVYTRKGNLLICAETKKEDNDEQDYYLFHVNAPGKFVVAIKDPEEFEEFFVHIDSSRIDCPSCKGCKDGSTYYQLSPNCYVCKEGFNITEKIRTLRVSRDGNFEFPVDKSVVSKPSKPSSSLEKLRKQNLERIYQGLNRGNDGSVIRESLPPGAGNGTSTNGDKDAAKTNQPGVNKQKMNEIEKSLEELLKDQDR